MACTMAMRRLLRILIYFCAASVLGLVSKNITYIPNICREARRAREVERMMCARIPVPIALNLKPPKQCMGNPIHEPKMTVKTKTMAIIRIMLGLHSLAKHARPVTPCTGSRNMLNLLYLDILSSIAGSPTDRSRRGRRDIVC